MDANAAKLEVGARSETGYVRGENQDRMTGDVGPFGPFYIVADGMGGHKAGALAAQLAVQELTRQIKEAPATASVEQVIQAAFKKANETIYQKGHAGDPEIDGMGTTAVLLLISGRVARLAHVGDSRAYLYRDGVLKQLTTDHTMVQKMVEEGLLKPEDAADHPNASVLERAIGTQQSVEVDISEELPLKDGDAILLCSDGLCGYVTDPEIESALRSPATSQEITTRLVDLALQKGGRDNVTVQFIQYGPRKAPASVEPAKPEKTATATAVVSASSPSGQPSARSEGRPAESIRLGKPATIPASKPGFFSFRTVAALILGAAISASGLYVFMNQRMAGFQGQLEETKNAGALSETKVKELERQLAHADQSGNKSSSKLQKELEETKTARVRAENRVKELETEVTKTRNDVKKIETAQKNAEKRVKELETDVSKIRNDLKNTEIAKTKAEKRVKELETDVSKIRDDLKKTEIAKTKAETDLKEKERELQEAKKQIQTPASKATQSKETEKAAGPEGTTAPGKTSGPGATPGQKETP
jgi:PPM family protein phosphatase